MANFLVIGAAALWPRKGELPAKRELDIANVFTLSPRHLWFIAYLLMISLIAIGVWLAIQRAPAVGAAINRGFRSLIKSWWAVPVLASISAAILITKTGWVAGGVAGNPRRGHLPPEVPERQRPVLQGRRAAGGLASGSPLALRRATRLYSAPTNAESRPVRRTGAGEPPRHLPQGRIGRSHCP